MLMRQLTRREIEKRYPLSPSQQLAQQYRKVLKKHYDGIRPPKIVGRLVQLKTTRDRYCEMTGIISSVRPTVREGDGDGGWYVWDSSSDTKTVWARDIFLVVEDES
jgi:hypothetical protein